MAWCVKQFMQPTLQGQWSSYLFAIMMSHSCAKLLMYNTHHGTQIKYPVVYTHTPLHDESKYIIQ